MSSEIHGRNRQAIEPLREALYDYDPNRVQQALHRVFHADAEVRLSWPHDTLAGAEGLYRNALEPLHRSVPDLERRDTIVMAGRTPQGVDWVGCCGYYTGSFEHPWLDIPATGHQVAVRFHEFFRMVDQRVTEMQAIWDVPGVMHQAGTWPMAPSLGLEWLVPGPASQDGLVRAPADDGATAASFALVHGMCESLGNYARGGVEAMQLDQYWHPRCSWYGPSGIGTARGIAGFRNWHQIPFLNGLPDRVGNPDEGHMFADGGYVGFTAWPGMHMTVSGDGWLGIPPTGRQISMRSLDFWRCEGGLIRENWVLVDLLDVYRQLGVDVFARLREFNKARRP